MKKIIAFFFLFCMSWQNSFSQSTLPAYAVYTNPEIEMKECPFDKDADAVILFDEAVSNYDDEYKLITTRRIRIKILNQRGLDRANIVIPFFSKDDFEYIHNIEGITYNTEDYSSSYLNRKSIFTEKLDDRISNMKFAMPNVKAGSIIEYKYESVMKHYGGLDNWIFQSDLPTIKSCFLLQILPNVEFNYVLSKKSTYPVTITPKPDVGQIYFEMGNIPGLRFEPYMDAPKDYLQRVEFQLSGYVTQYGTKKKVNNSWDDVSTSLATDEDLGGTLKKTLSVPDELKLAVEKETTANGKIAAIYNYVKNYFTWNGHNTKFTSESLKKILEKRTGSSGEINLVLLNFLQSFKIEASPLLVAERDFGRIDPLYPFIDRFNKTVAYAVSGNQRFILDASQKYCPPGLTPYSLLNTYALVIDKKQGKLIQIDSDSESFKTKINITAVLDKTGKLSGSAAITSDDYAKQLQTEEIKDDTKKFIAKNLEQPYEGLKIDNFTFDLPANDSAALTQQFTFTDALNENGGFVLLNYNLFTGLSKNPFKATERFTNINFGFPYRVIVEETIELPGGAKTDDLPRNRTLQIAGNDISISRQISREGNRIKIKLEQVQTVTLVSYNSYNELKDFYKQMIDMLNEPIVVKLDK